jgi:mannose-6-phosphate isomerase-like protein (cupin superfamily)
VPSYRVVRQADRKFSAIESPAASKGLSVATLISEQDGSVHVEVSVSELEPSGQVSGHLHPFEESFYILSGSALLSIDGHRYALGPDDFGFVPVATPHAWSNPHDEPVRWYRIRSPQPRPIGVANGTFPVPKCEVPTEGRAVSEEDPTARFVGHFTDADLNAPGPLSMPGYHGHNIRDISVRMMVDDVLGAIHHTHFMVQFAPREEEGMSGSGHFHAFEEAYFLLRGTGETVLEDEHFKVSAGDLVWVSTGCMHAWVNRGSEPLRFIELQAPRPPFSNMLFLERPWAELAERTIGGAS